MSLNLMTFALNGKMLTLDSDIYPKGLIQETLRTLALLIPPTDLESKNWFLRHHIQLPIDGEAARCVPLSKEERNIEKFE